MGWPTSLSLNVADKFAPNYVESRQRFRAVCAAVGAETSVHSCPEPGPGGEHLSTDVALFGPTDASRLMVVVSGTHGPEGLAGSGCQVGWMLEGGPQALPEDVAVLLVHLVNPWGTAWGRRQTENNVDLNRNFMNFTQPLPVNELYRELREVVSSAALEEPQRSEADRAIESFKARHGLAGLAQALFMGQYEHEVGVGFGGLAPTWSNATFSEILRRYAGQAQVVAVVDLHTGYGPYGYGMLLNSDDQGSRALSLAREWYGESLIAMKAQAGGVPYEVNGHLGVGATNTLPGATVVTVTIEYGTYSVERLLSLQLEDCWLQNHGDLTSPVGRKIREELRRFFYPGAPDWCQMVHVRAQQIFGQAIRGLSRWE